MPPVTVIYHADCLDGFGAAFAAWLRFGDRASYRPMHHGQPWAMADIAGHDVFVLDFSFPPATLNEMAGVAASVTQIDHHLSALKDWSPHLDGSAIGHQAYRSPELPLQLIFNLDKSGARLAWEHFHPETPLPHLIRHIEEQDLWRFQPDITRPFCRALRLQAFDFPAWHALLQETGSTESPRYQAMLTQGRAIDQFFEKEVRLLAGGQQARLAKIRGEPADELQARRHGLPIIVDGPSAWLASTGLAVNANALFASELGNLLAEQSGSWGLVWHLAGDGEVKVSLRAKGAVDVAEIARRYGGGGHRNAAGFRLPARQFLNEVLGLPA